MGVLFSFEEIAGRTLELLDASRIFMEIVFFHAVNEEGSIEVIDFV